MWAAWSTRRMALALFSLLVIVYQVNGTVLEEGDPVPNLKLPIALLKRGTLWFTPDDFPEMFHWRSTAPLIQRDDFSVDSWEDQVAGKTLGEWRAQNALHFKKPRYYLLESPVRHVYVSTFGPIPGITFVPIVAVLRLINPVYDVHHTLSLSAAKLHGALLMAASSVLLFLTAMRYTTRWRALLIGAIFGLATCAWSIQSQNVWQQTVSSFLICIGIFFFTRAPESPRDQLIAGLAFGAATACRHTGALMLVCAFAYLAIYHRKSAIYLALGSIPVPAAIAGYNWYLFGSVFSFGQELVGYKTALEKTGSPDLWQTPLLKGAWGLLVSPSRGLLVFSPFFVFAAVGLFRIFRDPRYRALRPLSIGALCIMALQCKWFDWWGGWTYGYRPWADGIPVLCLCLVPTVANLTPRSVRAVLFGALIVWSVFVQFIGAFAYDKNWNDRMLYAVDVPGRANPLLRLTEAAALELARERGGAYVGTDLCNIDERRCRYRLWSLPDNIILYYVSYFREARAHRPRTAWSALFRRQ